MIGEIAVYRGIALAFTGKWKRKVTWDDVDLWALKDCPQWDLYVLLKTNEWIVI